MKTQIKILLLLIFISSQVVAQTSISGIVKSKLDNKPVPEVNIIVEPLQIGTATDKEGKFELGNLPLGKFKIVFSHVGYKTKIVNINISKETHKVLKVFLEEKPVMLGEVTVTSSRTKHLLKDIPLPVEVVTSGMIDNVPLFSPSDAMDKVPGVNLMRDGIWGTTVSIRGISKQNLVYLIDGDRIETATNHAGGLSLIDMFDVKQIEIIKGGISSLYGSGATGGVINIKTEIPGFSSRLSFGGSSASGYNSVNKNTSANVKIFASNRNWYAKLSGSIRNAGDATTASGTKLNSKFKDKSISALLGLKFSDKIKTEFKYQNFLAKDVGIPGGLPFPESASVKYKLAFRELMEGKINFSNITKRLTNLSAKYYRQIIKREVELIPNANAVVSPGATHTTDGLFIQSNYIINRNQLLIAGLDMWQRRYDGHRSKEIIPLKKIIVDKPVASSVFKNIGLFAQDEIMLANKRLNLTLSGRYDFIFIHSDETRNPQYIIDNGIKITPPANPDASFRATDETNKSFSGSLGVLYRLNNQWDLTFNGAYTFRSPSLEERFQYIDLGASVYLGNPALQPEKGLFLDAGLRFTANRFKFKGNVFLNNYKDLVIDDVVIPDSVYKKENVGQARFSGFDFSLEYNFYGKSMFYLNSSYVVGKDIKSNKYLPQIPPLNGRVGITWNFENVLGINLEAIYASDQNKVAENENPTPGYVVYDLIFNFSPVKLGLLKIHTSFGVQNLFNRSYRNHLTSYRGLFYEEPGRNIFAKVRIIW